MDIFKLVGSVFVDTDKANQNLDKTDKKASGLGSTLAKMGKGAAIAGGAIVAGAGAAVGSVVALAKNTASTADQIDKASIRMGVSAESYQEMAYAAELAGVNTGSLESAARKLEGTDLNLDDAMSQIMSLGTAEERSAMAAELFGDKLAYELSPLIEQTGEEFAATRQQANDLGLVMSGDAVKSGAAMNDSMTMLTKSLSSLGNDIAVAVMPLVQQLTGFLIDNMPTIKQMISALTPVIEVVFSAASKVLTFIMQYVPPILTTVTNVITGIVGAITGGTTTAGQTFERFRQKVSTVFSAIKDAVKTPVNAILGFINGLIRGVTGGVNGVIRALNMLHVDVPGWVTALTGVQSLGFNIAEVSALQIPLLAKGGVLSDGVAIVGEDGPELIQASSRKTTVTPLNDNNNGFVELSKKLDTLIEIMSNGFGVRLDTGAMVGQLAPAMDMELGSMAYNARRYV